MGTIGTFDGFTTARLAIYAAHKGLSVTGHNIANLNTSGYTRQVIDQVSLKVGANDMYRSQLDNHVGTGVLVTGINQIRDPYLDIRFRNTSSDVGYYDKKLSGLQEIADILDEVGKGENKGDGLLYKQLCELADSLRALGEGPNSDDDTLTRASASALVSLFRDYASKLQGQLEDTKDEYHQSISSVNEILTNIRNLNSDIRQNEIFGDSALELRDERNRQIDELSKYMKINVTYSMEDVGAGKQVEKLTITLGDANPDDSIPTDTTLLIDGIYGAQIDSPPQLPVLNPDFGKRDENTNTPLAGSEFLYLDENGAPTNDINKAAKKENPNYLVTVSKLLDSKGREWEDSKTTWTEAANGTPGVKAIYELPITSTGWVDGNELEIGGKVFKIGAGGAISVADANDPAKMAAFLAKNLKSDDYTIGVNGAKLVFTAKKAGAVPGNGAAQSPSVTFKPGQGSGATTGAITPGTATATTLGVDSIPPTPIPPVTVGNYTTTTSFVETDGKWYQVTTVTQHTNPVELHDNDLHGSLQAIRELLTEKGEFATQDDIDLDPSALIKRGIPYYQKSLDLLARQIAKQYNALNQGYMVNQNGNYIDKDGNELMLAEPDGTLLPVSKNKGLTEGQKANLINNYYMKDEKGDPILDADGNKIIDFDGWMKDNNAYKPEGAGNLFSNRNDRDDDTEITASNISISHSWSSRAVKVVPTHVKLFPTGDKEKDDALANSTQSENISHMITMIDTKLIYDPKDLDPDAKGDNIFNGSFNDMMSNTCTVLGNDRRDNNVKLNNSYTTQITIDTTRDGVSGVDLNDEAMNMMTYQKAYTAACRLMTAMDEALDRLINNTGIAGR